MPEDKSELVERGNEIFDRLEERHLEAQGRIWLRRVADNPSPRHRSPLGLPLYVEFQAGRAVEVARL